MTNDDAARFDGKIDKSGDCWNWTSALNTSGYGVFWLNGKAHKAHRLSYERHVGPIPGGKEPDHLCRNRRCVRPDHMEPVTHEVNMRRGHWGSKTHCPVGHEYTPENTYVCRSRRYCRSCRQAET